MKTLNSLKYSAIAAAALSVQAFAADDNQDLEEVLVTAQKRVQNAQQVPVAVTAFSDRQLRELGVTDVFDLQTSAPSLQVGSSQTSSATNFSIRGVGTSSQNFGLESSVGVYIDGVYRSRQSAAINELIDIDAVEILRGPQGTLFGRNTPSGAIQINTAAPREESDAFVNVSAGNFGLVSASAAVGGAIGDSKWSFRTTAFTSQRDGFVSDENLGDDVINDRDRNGVRAQLQYKPSDSFSARLIADYSEIDEICCAAVTVRNNFIGAAGQRGTDLLLSAFGGNIVSEDRVFDDVTALNTLPVSRNEDSGVSLELKIGHEKDGQLTSITSVRNFEEFTDVDLDFTDVDLFSRQEEATTKSFSQEIRYAGETSNFDYVIGAYYFDQTLDSISNQNIGPAFSPFLLREQSIAQLVGAATAFGLPVAEITPAGSGARDVFTQDQQSAAVFGQFDFYLSDSLTATAGIRYTDEKKSVNGVFTQGNTGPTVDLAAIGAGDLRSIQGVAFPGWGFTLGGPLTVISARDNVVAEVDDSQVTGTLKLAYSTNKHSLYYAAYTTGFKSGGTNTDRINPRFNTIFGAETSASFELGMKRDFPSQGLRLNVSLHSTNTDDFQTVAFTGEGFNLINAGEVQTKGGEIEVLWYPTDTLSLTGALVINDGEYQSFPGATCWGVTPFLTGQQDPTDVNGVCDRTGEDLSFNPEETVIFSINKQLAIGSRDAYLHADYFYRSSAFEDGDNDPLKEQDGYGLLNLRTGMFFGDNSTEISLWMRNALDEDYLGTRFSAPLQTGKLNAYAQEPRTYGISVRKEF